MGRLKASSRFKKDNTVVSNPYAIDNRASTGISRTTPTTRASLRRHYVSYPLYSRPHHYSGLGRGVHKKRIIKYHSIHQSFPRTKRRLLASKAKFKKDNTKKFTSTRFSLRRKADPVKVSVVSQSNEIRRQAVKRSIKSIYRLERKRSLRTSSPSTSSTTQRLCLFYTRFGRCTRQENSCTFIHDAAKVAVCTRFLRGTCNTTKCPFSHKCIPEKIPVCEYYLRGMCSRQPCLYRHVNVGPTAPICQDFIRLGHCFREECSHHHLMFCPDFAKTGLCAKSKCSLRHSRLVGTVMTHVANHARDDEAVKTKKPKPSESKDFIPIFSSDSSNDDESEKINEQIQR